MRYQPAHAATDPVPLALRAPQSLRRTLSAVVAAAIGFVPVVLVASPAHAAPGDVAIDSDLEGPEADTFTFELRRTGGSADPLTLAYSTTGGSATPNEDFVPISGTTTFPASTRDVVKRFTVSGIADNLDEADETFSLTFTGTTAGGQAVTVTAGGILDDDDATPTYTLSVVNPVSEGTSNATVTATLSAVSGRDVTIPVSTGGGTATAGQDYTALNNATISIAAGSTTGTVNVPMMDDALDEADLQTFVVTGSAGTNVAGTASTTVQIADNDATPTVSIGSPGAAAESSSLTFPLTLSAASERTVTVVTDTADGAATAGTDYTAVTGNTVTFAPGSTSETVVVVTTQDSVDETDPEDFTVTMSDPANAVLDSTASATGTVNDDDIAPTLTLTPGAVAEGDSGPQVRTFTATLDAPSGRTVQVGYDVSGGTATAGTDYTATSGTLTFAPGETVKTFTVSVTGDQIDEDPDETFNVVLSNSAGTVAGGGSLGTTTVTITDDDAIPTFSVADVTVAEGTTTVARTFTVTLSNPSAQPISFDVSSADASAEDAGTGPGDNDYDVPSATVTVAPGDTTAVVPLNVVGDTVFEDDETATVTVARAAGETDATGAADTSTLTLTNDDAVPAVTLSSASGVEGSSIALMGTVTGVAQDAIAVSITLAGSSAGGSNPAESGDFTYAGPISASIPAGDNTGSPVALTTIQLDNDAIDEAPEAFLATLTDPASNVATATATQTVTDDPNDLPPSVSIGDVNVNEDAGTAAVPVSLAFDTGQATSTERPVVVGYQTTGASATAGSDFTAAGSGATVTIAPGTTSGTIPVAIIDDPAYERSETFTVTATSVDPSEAVIADATGTATIASSDTSARPTFSIAGLSRAESATGPAAMTVTLSGPSTQDVDLTVGIADGTAADAGSGAGSNDFDAPVTTLTVPAGATTATVLVPVNADTVYEANETAVVTVALATGEDDATGPASTGTLTLLNDDAAPSLALNSESSAEGTDIVVSATVTGVAQATTTLNLTLSGDGTGTNDAAEAADFVDSNAQATIPAGTASGTVLTLRTFRLNNDTADEPTESVRVQVADAAGAAPTVSSIYRVTDDPNDLPPAVSLGDVTVAEGAGNATVPVNLSFGAGNDATSTERPVVVDYSTTQGTAAAGSDFTASSAGQVTIAAGATSGTIAVPVLDDIRDEFAETFTVTASGVTPTEAAIADSSATVTITDNDPDVPKPTFTVTDVSRNENAGPANVTVELSAATDENVTFAIGTQDGTAVDGGTGTGSNDYNAPVTTLTIAAGQTSATVPVTINADAVHEEDETVTVTVALADGELDATGPVGEATLTIVNDDAKPTLTLNTASGFEGDDVEVSAVVSGTAQNDVTYELTSGGYGAGTSNPAEDGDYDASGLEALIPAGTASGTRVTFGSITLAGDTVDEPTESIRVVAHDPDAGDTSGDRTSIYRIFDDPDDLPPAVSIGDVSVDEGDETAEIDVSLTFPGDTDATEQSLTVGWTTVDGTARAALDYVAGSGTLQIDAGAEGGTITVPLVDGSLSEPEQAFSVRLTTASPNGVEIARELGEVVVADDDAPSAPVLTAPVSRVGPGPVTLTGQAGEGSTVRLYAAPVSAGSDRVLVATTTASTTGAYTFNRPVPVGYTFATRVGELSSPVRTVRVVQQPVLTGASTARGTATLTVTGSPRTAGQDVQIQRQNANGAWSTVARGELTSAGTYTTTLRNQPSATFVNYRAIISTTPELGILAGTSPVRRLGIR